LIVLSRGAWSVLGTAPTGSDKTVIAFELVSSSVAARQRILVLAHRSEIIDQTIGKLRDNRQGEEMAACHGGFGWRSLRGCGDDWSKSPAAPSSR
jgi:superfamily II DNA or RNA helicase